MLKTLRVPERLFRAVTWAVSILFAAFLVGFGGLVIADLPKIGTRLDLEDFADRPALFAARSRHEAANTAADALVPKREQALHAMIGHANAYRAARAQHENWLKTRIATTDPSQDAELVARTRQLDDLKARERIAQQAVETIDGALLAHRSSARAAAEREADLLAAAAGPYHSALNWQQLRIFLWRLAVTLPLLVAAWWIATHKRHSDYWLLYRGFIGFAVFTFFVELVPYLPSYGGYVRYGIGIVLTGLAGHYTINGMRAYLARRREAEQRTEVERRRELPPDEALKKMQANQCPGCERPIMSGESRPDFCVHCGLRLFESCGTCTTRKNVFFQFCAKCGTPGATAQAA